MSAESSKTRLSYFSFLLLRCRPQHIHTRMHALLHTRDEHLRFSIAENCQACAYSPMLTSNLS